MAPKKLHPVTSALTIKSEDGRCTSADLPSESTSPQYGKIHKGQALSSSPKNGAHEKASSRLTITVSPPSPTNTHSPQNGKCHKGLALSASDPENLGQDDRENEHFLQISPLHLDRKRISVPRLHLRTFMPPPPPLQKPIPPQHHPSNSC